MLKKISRLTKTKDFDLVMQKGKAGFSPVLMVKFVKNGLDNSRLGIIVSNKVSKKATARNLIKRRIREILRKNYSQIAPGIDLAVIASPRIIGSDKKALSYQEIEKFLLLALKKAGVL